MPEWMVCRFPSRFSELFQKASGTAICRKTFDEVGGAHMLVVRFTWCMALAGFLGIFASGSHLAQADQTALIKVDGSSSVYPLTEAVAEEFQKANRGRIRVTVGISGTGGGFKKFCRGETDISDASRPIL
jgi:phosphate transport system substrate-binding protein